MSPIDPHPSKKFLGNYILDLCSDVPEADPRHPSQRQDDRLLSSGRTKRPLTAEFSHQTCRAKEDGTGVARPTLPGRGLGGVAGCGCGRGSFLAERDARANPFKLRTDG